MLRDESFRSVLRREVDQISLPSEEMWLPRSSGKTVPWSGLAVAAGVGVIAILLAVALSAARQGTAPIVLATPAPPVTSATASREPSGLAVLPEEQAVLDAFNQAGMDVRLIGASKFESDLGVPLSARVFIVVPGSQGADILFLPATGIGDIRVCAAPGAAPGWTRSDVFVNGQRVSSGESGRPVYHLLNARYFAITYDVATRDALAHGLGLTAAQC
jgi:hypothetical protein